MKILSAGLRPFLKVLPHTGKPETQPDRRRMLCAQQRHMHSNKSYVTNKECRAFELPDTDANRATGLNTHTQTHTHGWMTWSAMCTRLWQHGSEVTSEMMPG